MLGYNLGLMTTGDGINTINDFYMNDFTMIFLTLAVIWVENSRTIFEQPHRSCSRLKTGR